MGKEPLNDEETENKLSSPPDSELCQTSYFIEPMKWMLESLKDDLKQLEGSLKCPKCSFKIGTWKWEGMCDKR